MKENQMIKIIDVAIAVLVAFCLGILVGQII
jgi:hypothetical protein